MNITVPLLAEAFCTFAILSYLYRENPFYRVGENMFIGIAVGHILVMSINTVMNSAIGPLLAGDILYAIPILLGLSLYFYFSKSYRHIYLIPMALLIGVGVGIGVRGEVHGTILKLLIANINIIDLSQNIVSNINGLIIALGSLLILFYFIFTFSIERKGTLGQLSKSARYLLMITFGASFANSVMANTTYLSDRVIFLWLTDAKYLVLVAAMIFLIGILYDRARTQPEKAKVI